MSRAARVAEAIADGLPVDWSGAEPAGASDDERARLAELRLIARIAAAHTSQHLSLRSSRHATDVTEPPPATWGLLRVEERLGRGAYGDVYRAWDPRLERAVALKLLRRGEPGDDAHGAAVIDEGRLQAKVRHPGVVSIYGADRVEGRVGLWMELVEGRTLEAELRARGPLSHEEVVKIGLQLCDALTAVHDAGLLHRDIKTQNVIWAPDGRLVLGDFGTGQPVDDSVPSLEAPAAEPTAGTPLYMAPELFEGGVASVQSELYALGVLLYHVATGSYPVGGRIIAELRASHQAGRRAAVLERRPDLPPHLSRAIMRAIEPDPVRRPVSAAEFKEALTEGTTLADRIEAGPIPLHDALGLSRQLAALLQEAHARGVVHGHLTPARVKERDDGSLVLLDVAGASRSDQDAAYQAPEQVAGQNPGPPADVWAFGCLVYEMLTGRAAFGEHGEDVDPAALPTELPPGGHRLLRRCLAPLPTDRLRDLREGVLQVEEQLAEARRVPDHAGFTDPAMAQTRDVARPAVWGGGLGMAAAIALAAVTGLATWMVTGRELPSETQRLTMTLPVTAPLSFAGLTTSIAISPDGRSVVYGGPSLESGRSRLNLRSFGRATIEPIATTEGGQGPFFSADSAWVGFTDEDGTTVSKVSLLEGGAPVVMARTPRPVFGASWSRGGALILGTQGGGLLRVTAEGAEPEELTVTDVPETEVNHTWPFLVEEHDVVLFVASPSEPLRTGALAAFDLTTGRTVSLGLEGFSPRYLSTGHLIYATEDRSLQAIAFDPSTLTTSGSPVPLVEDIDVKLSGAAAYDVAEDGRLVYVRSQPADQQTLAWVTPSGVETPIPIAPSAYKYPRLSPDGRLVALDDRNQGNDIWIWSFENQTRERVATGHDGGTYPVWTPDSQRLAFETGGAHVYWKEVAGGGPAEPLLEQMGKRRKQAPSPYFFSRDGVSLVLRDPATPGSGDDLRMVTVGDPGTATWVVDGEDDERNAVLSPDGRWMAYQAEVDGRFEVFVRSFPAIDDRRAQVSSAGGQAPLFARDGRELYYLSPTGMMMAVAVVPVPADEPFTFSERRELFPFRYLRDVDGRTYDVAGDGRFLVIDPLGGLGPAARREPDVEVVLGWSAEVRERVPTE